MPGGFTNWFKTRTFIGRCWQRYSDYVKLCLTSGHIPKVRPWLVYPSRLLMRLWRYVQVGRTRVVGAENLAVDGKLIICSNHSSLFDAIVVHPSMKHPVVRFMGAYESMDGLLGLKPILLTAIGCFPVDRKHGSTVLGPATDLLAHGNDPIFMCPEGKIYNSGIMGEFKPGAALIARAAYEKLDRKERVGIVPIHICYGKRNVKTGDTFNFWKMGLSWRGGVTLFIGKPIWIHEHLEKSAGELMALLKSRIAAFQCPTSGACPKS